MFVTKGSAAQHGADLGSESRAANLYCASAESLLLGGALNDSLAAVAMRLASEAMEEGSMSPEVGKPAKILQDQCSAVCISAEG